jgi:hypothetical protein
VLEEEDAVKDKAYEPQETKQYMRL